jgi:hypothetical protein
MDAFIQNHFPLNNSSSKWTEIEMSISIEIKEVFLYRFSVLSAHRTIDMKNFSLKNFQTCKNDFVLYLCFWEEKIVIQVKVPLKTFAWNIILLSFKQLLNCISPSYWHDKDIEVHVMHRKVIFSTLKIPSWKMVSCKNHCEMKERLSHPQVSFFQKKWVISLKVG